MHYKRWAYWICFVSNVEDPAQKVNGIIPWVWVLDCVKKELPAVMFFLNGRPHSKRDNWPHTWTFQALILQIRPSRYKVAQPVTFKPKSLGLI